MHFTFEIYKLMKRRTLIKGSLADLATLYAPEFFV